MDEKLKGISPGVKEFVDSLLLATGMTKEELELLNSSDEELKAQIKDKGAVKNIGEQLEKASDVLHASAVSSLAQSKNTMDVLAQICTIKKENK